MQAEIATAHAELAKERMNTREHKSAAETMKSIMDEELGETKAEREKWMQKKAILERAHIKDMTELKEQQEGLRESDLANFRALLKEEQDKLQILEKAWTGLLAGPASSNLNPKTKSLILYGHSWRRWTVRASTRET